MKKERELHQQRENLRLRLYATVVSSLFRKLGCTECVVAHLAMRLNQDAVRILVLLSKPECWDLDVASDFLLAIGEELEPSIVEAAIPFWPPKQPEKKTTRKKAGPPKKKRQRP